MAATMIKANGQYKTFDKSAIVRNIDDVHLAHDLRNRISHEVGQPHINFRRLVLLCNTYDAHILQTSVARPQVHQYNYIQTSQSGQTIEEGEDEYDDDEHPHYRYSSHIDCDEEECSSESDYSSENDPIYESEDDELQDCGHCGIVSSAHQDATLFADSRNASTHSLAAPSNVEAKKEQLHDMHLGERLHKCMWWLRHMSMS